MEPCINEFSFCCGAHEVEAEGLIVSDLRAYLKREDKERTENMATIGAVIGQHPGCLIATTTSDQRTAVRALRENGFEKVFTFGNPGTGNRITLWARQMLK